MKSKNPVIWDRTPDLENLVEQVLNESGRLDERDVAVKFGVAGQESNEYVIPEEEVAEIDALLDASTDPESPEGSPSRRLDTSTADGYRRLIDSVAARYAPENAAAPDLLQSIVQQYWRSGNIGAKALKILFSQPDNVEFPLFSHTNASIPEPGGLGGKLLELDYAKKAGAVGKGELLALLLYGGVPSPPGQEVDIQLTDEGSFTGAWHVKYMRSFTPGETVPWGEAGKPVFIEALRNQLNTINGIDDATKSKIVDLMDSKSGFKPAQAAEKLATAGVNPEQMESVADAFDSAINVLAQSGGSGVTANGVLYTGNTEFKFVTASPTNRTIKFAFLANKTGRISIGGPNRPSFWSLMEGSRATRESNQGSWEEFEQRMQQTNQDVDAIAQLYYAERSDGHRSLKNALSHRGIGRNAVYDWLELQRRSQFRTSLEGYTNMVRALLRPEEEWVVNESKKNLRLQLLVEELTRSDKKDIEKMIRKRIEADRAEQKRQFKKHLAEEMKKSKFQQTILEMAKEEMGKELKGKQLESVVVDVTKKVIKKLYREMSHAYNPVIDRIKL